MLAGYSTTILYMVLPENDTGNNDIDYKLKHKYG